MFAQTKKFLVDRMPAAPSVAVVLGSGLGGFAEELVDRVEIPYGEIPGGRVRRRLGMPGSWCSGSLGRLMWRCFRGVPICTRAIRRARVTYAMRVMKLLGVKVSGAYQCRRRHQPGSCSVAVW